MVASARLSSPDFPAVVKLRFDFHPLLAALSHPPVTHVLASLYPDVYSSARKVEEVVSAHEPALRHVPRLVRSFDL